MKIQFISKKFSQASRERIDLINGILAEYRRQGFRLSLRQLYYQLVARDYIPNSQREYKNVGNLVSDARQAGLIDWDMIEDRNREYETLSHWENPAHIMESVMHSFRIDKWADQPYHIEVMVEKDALSGVLRPVCNELDIGITANKGYSSTSTMFEAGQRIRNHARNGKQITLIYLGDHDPSGIDMTRDIDDRLNMYSFDAGIEVVRLALNYDQVQLWNPPENPAKMTDSRADAYVARYGESSWELDAVEPATLADLVRQAVLERRDEDIWQATLAKENRMIEALREATNNMEWEDEDD